MPSKKRSLWFKKPDITPCPVFEYYERIDLDQLTLTKDKKWLIDVKWFGNRDIYCESLDRIFNDDHLEIYRLLLDYCSKNMKKNVKEFERYICRNLRIDYDKVKYFKNFDADTILYDDSRNIYYKIIKKKEVFECLKWKKFPGKSFKIIEIYYDGDKWVEFGNAYWHNVMSENYSMYMNDIFAKNDVPNNNIKVLVYFYTFYLNLKKDKNVFIYFSSNFEKYKNVFIYFFKKF